MAVTLRAQGTQGILAVDGVDVVSLPKTGPAPFRNILINGEVTRINQRGVANWGAVADGAFGYDRWKRINSTTIQQTVEAGNFKPNTVYTLSGNLVTTQQLTSPASGNWAVQVPIDATYLQLEEGLIATPFEVRPIDIELARCQRYFEVFDLSVQGAFSGDTYNIAGGVLYIPIVFKFTKARIVDSPVNIGVPAYNLNNITSAAFSCLTKTGVVYSASVVATGRAWAFNTTVAGAGLGFNAEI